MNSNRAITKGEGKSWVLITPDRPDEIKVSAVLRNPYDPRLSPREHEWFEEGTLRLGALRNPFDPVLDPEKWTVFNRGAKYIKEKNERRAMRGD